MKVGTNSRWSRQGGGGLQPGRSPLSDELRELARSNARAAVEAILKVMNDARASAPPRLAAAAAILELAVGHERGTAPEDDFAEVLRAASEIMARRAATESAGGPAIAVPLPPVKY